MNLNWLKKPVKRIRNNAFAKGVLLISSGTVFAQAAGFFLLPIITRIYTPEEYGVFGVYIAALTILAIGTFNYEFGIPIAENKNNAIILVVLSTCILVGYVALMFLILGFFSAQIFNFFEGGDSLLDYKFLVPIGILISGLFSIFRQWSFREKNYKNISRATIRQSISGNLTKIGLGISGCGALGLIVGNIISAGVGFLTLSRSFLKKEMISNRNYQLGNSFEIAKRYIKFPLYQTPNSFMVKAGQQLPIIFLTSIYGVEVSGFFGLAVSVVMLPMVLIGDSIGDVFYAEAASIGKSNPLRLKKLSNNLLKKLAVLSFPFFIIFFSFGPLLFTIVFGENWYEAGVFSRILSIYLFGRMLFYPISRIYTVYEKQKELLILNTLNVFLIIIIFMISKLLKFEPYNTILLYSITMLFSHFINYVYAQWIITNEIEKKKMAKI